MGLVEFFFIMVAIFAILLPIGITMVEIDALICTVKGKPIWKPIRRRMMWVDLAAVFLGVFYDVIYLFLAKSAMFGKDWWIQLTNLQRHTPVSTEHGLILWVIFLLGMLGYGIVSRGKVEKSPPLLFVLSMSAMYLAVIESVVWTVQIYESQYPEDMLFFFLPVCALCLTARVVLTKIKEWKEYTKLENTGESSNLPAKKTFLNWCDGLLFDSNRWPAAAFLLMWPLLGLIVGILVLFGQKPDAWIRAWTETSDWNLSQKVSPQNIYYDEHYLCTVAAGGHEQIVRPLRLGVRHGHQVIVNRQLCVANAFEQILEERTPRLHRRIRSFYDTYGFPVAKWIRSRYLADVIYLLMKPLEWIFLIVIYLTDAKPENRIALQYTGKTWKDFQMAEK